MRTETTRTLSVAGISIVSLLGVLMSVYLLLVKYGYIGTLACGASGGCSTVQSSRWAVLLGVPVPGRRLTVRSGRSQVACPVGVHRDSPARRSST